LEEEEEGEEEETNLISLIMKRTLLSHLIMYRSSKLTNKLHQFIKFNPLGNHQNVGTESVLRRWKSLHRSIIPQSDVGATLEETIDDSHSHDESHRCDSLSGPNPGLASIISQGTKSLKKSAADIEFRTRNSSLSKPHKKGSFRAGTLEPRQIAEGQRILDVASECLEQLAMQAERGAMSLEQRKGLFLSAEPIVLLECVVNRNIKQAKLYWTLPYGILLDGRLHARLYHQITAKVQEQLMMGGGATLLARKVHSKLSSYYPPRIKMLPATDEMVAQALKESTL
jgi:hypothetical protein